MTALAMLHAEVREIRATHGLSGGHPAGPVVGCPACIPTDRAAAVQEMIDTVSTTLTDAFRGQDENDPARRLLAWIDLATYRGLMPSGDFVGTLIAPPTGTTMPCGAEIAHEEHVYVRRYVCEGT